jgi:hypothetical protein
MNEDMVELKGKYVKQPAGPAHEELGELLIPPKMSYVVNGVGTQPPK